MNATGLFRRGVGAFLLALLGFSTVWAHDPEADAGGFGEVSGSLTLASDYMFRGISNSNNEPQVQGDLTWAHDSGVYAGVWASNTDFGGPGNSMEIDPYVGFARPIGDSGVSYDVGVWSYNYPGSEFDFDYWEAYAMATYAAGALSITPSVWYADNYFGEDFIDEMNGLAYEVASAYRLPRGFSVSARVGEQTFGSGRDDLDYTYWDLGIAKDIGRFTWDLRWHDTDDISATLADPDLADGELVLSLTRHF